MCNFIIRPIKSHATVDLMGFDFSEVGKAPTAEVLVKRGESVLVQFMNEQDVVCEKDDKSVVSIPISTFVHSFTANPDDVEKVRKEEHKIMGYDPNKKKKDSKES